MPSNKNTALHPPACASSPQRTTRTRFRVRWGDLLSTLMAGALGAALMIGFMTNATPCAHEGDLWCHWNAATQGNGAGDSFTTYWDGFALP